jgi:hypothetical protein
MRSCSDGVISAAAEGEQRHRGQNQEKMAKHAEKHCRGEPRGPVSRSLLPTRENRIGQLETDGMQAGTMSL